MDANLSVGVGRGYISPAQQARVVTESWAEKNLYCVACNSNRVGRNPNNAEAVDFTCPSCRALYQLKASKGGFSDKVLDGAYDAMLRSLRGASTPHLLLMSYDTTSSSVKGLTLIPGHFLSSSAIEPRKPLGPTARRAGWRGCYINLSHVPVDGKIVLIDSDRVASIGEVRGKFAAARGLSKLSFSSRGWALDVLNLLRDMGKSLFSLSEVYAHEQQFKEKYPRNRHIRPKIRQQLQVLRDMGFVEFLGQGQYRMRECR